MVANQPGDELVAISGSCLCGGVKFEIARAEGPSEICHCTRCRKKSGSTSLEMINVLSKDFKLLSGADLIRSYAAPILNRPPAYVADFCSRCGSSVPPASPPGDMVEIPAGLFDDDPVVRPDKHIFVDFMPSWQVIRDSLPQLTLRELIRHRFGHELPKDYQAVNHNGDKHRF